MRIARNFADAELSPTSHGDLWTPPSRMPYAALVMSLRGVHAFLVPCRDFFGAPAHINSGYRSPQLNERVGGAASSRHRGITQDGYFWAYDFTVSGHSARSVFSAIARGEVLCEFDRLCLYVNEDRLHADGREDDNRKLFYVESGSGWEPITREQAGEM